MNRYVVRAYKGYKIVRSQQRIETLAEAHAVMDQWHATLGRADCDRIVIEQAGYDVAVIRDR